MNIALDYDNCYTRDPECWNNIIKVFQESGHNVMVVTMRYPAEAVDQSLSSWIPVHYTERRAKRDYMIWRGVSIDIWIDDTPDAILYNFS